MMPIKKADGKLREMQLKTFDLLCNIDRICKKNNIKYSLFGGTIIGAIVHKGFIPWDDDIDLVMDRENFNRFKSICEDGLPDNLEYKDYFKDNKSFVLFSKIIDKSTTCIMTNQYGNKIISGVFVDITVLDNIPSNKLIRTVQYLASLLMILYVNKNSPENRGKLINLGGKIFLKITPKNLYPVIVKKIFKFVTGFKRNSNTYLDEIIAINAPKINLDADTLDEFVEFEFEGRKFPVFKKYHEYLTKRYKRDYTTLPPEDEQLPQHNVEYINCEIGYKEYTMKSLKNRK